MKEKIKRTVSAFLRIISVMIGIFLLLTAPDVRAEEGTEVINEEASVVSNDTITVYNDPAHNGHFFYYKDGVPITVYCYHHERLQPSMNGTAGYRRYDYFSSVAEDPSYPVTKEMMATILYLGYPANATGLMEHWKIAEYPAIDAVQAVVWAIVKGDRTDWLQNYSYGYDLQYYGQNPASPYFNKIRNLGSVSIKERVSGSQEADGRYRTENVAVEGDFTGTFWFTNLPDNVKVYDAKTDTEITKDQKLTVQNQIYFVYTGMQNPGEIRLEYQYDTHEVFYLKTDDTRYQDMVGTEVKKHYGNLSLNFQEEPKVSYTVTKRWDDAENQDGLRPQQVLVQLKANGVSYGEAVALNESNGWKHVWENLPESENGQKIQYEAEETEIPAGYIPSYQEENGEHIIVNTHTPELISKEVTKIWKDDEDMAKKRPGYIEVQLKADGIVKETVRLDKENDWKYRWESLPKYEKGKKISYTVQEINVPEGYHSETNQETFEITNTITKNTLQIVKKNKANGEVLRGARFKIEALGTNQEVLFAYEVETNEEGLSELALPYGSYRLTEIQAPEGFIKLEEPIAFTVNEQGISGTQAEIKEADGKYVIEIENEKAETIVLPQAGGTGTAIFYQTGAGAILAAAALCIIYYQKERKHGKKKKME